MKKPLPPFMMKDKAPAKAGMKAPAKPKAKAKAPAKPGMKRMMGGGSCK